MLPQVWPHQAAVAVLTQVARDGTKTRMTLNGHATVQEWQTACVSVGKDFTDKLTTKNKNHGNWKI
ncbi:hypothetical protein BACFIN_04746 [Bacteroides finegoldii DSM 17565]|nr:hypothetical protein BACFIN_04746 [Bacteroides finegoldii DSM 17565]